MKDAIYDKFGQPFKYDFWHEISGGWENSASFDQSVFFVIAINIFLIHLHMYMF